MSTLGDYFYVSPDIPFFYKTGLLHWLKKAIGICFPDIKNNKELLDTRGVFNSGIIGGTRHVMLSLLSRMTLLLDNAHLGEPCDMVSLQIISQYYYNRVISTYPLSGGYMLGMPGPYGIAMKHKLYTRFIPGHHIIFF